MLWRGQAIGEIVGGTPFAPKARLDGELGAAAARERATRRVEAFVADAARPGVRQPRPAEGGGRGRRAEGSRARARLSARRGAGRAAAPRGRGICARALSRRAQGAARSRPALRRLHDLCRGSRRAGGRLDSRDFRPPRRPAMAPRSRACAAAARKPAARGPGLSRLARRWPGLAAPIAALERIGEIARARRGRLFAYRPRRWRASAGARPRASACCAASASSPPARRCGAGAGRPPGPLRRKPRQVYEAPPSPGAASAPGEPCRIDVWLWRARFCKTRALAAKRVADGEVAGMRQGAPIALDKPSRQIRARRRADARLRRTARELAGAGR